jgi:hypothetical protein
MPPRSGVSRCRTEHGSRPRAPRADRPAQVNEPRRSVPGEHRPAPCRPLDRWAMRSVEVVRVAVHEPQAHPPHGVAEAPPWRTAGSPAARNAPGALPLHGPCRRSRGERRARPTHAGGYGDRTPERRARSSRDDRLSPTQHGASLARDRPVCLGGAVPRPDTFPPARTRIFEAASLAFYRRGIGAVGVDAIVAEADVAKSTLYQHPLQARPRRRLLAPP